LTRARCVNRFHRVLLARLNISPSTLIKLAMVAVQCWLDEKKLKVPLIVDVRVGIDTGVVAGRIHLAGTTRRRLNGEFEFEQRGAKDVKGKGGRCVPGS